MIYVYPNVVITLVLFLGSAVFALAGSSILLEAGSAIHQIAAFVLFLISAVLFVGACVVDAINTLRKELRVEEE